jgi:ligand-binding sensor domain-containing protein
VKKLFLLLAVSFLLQYVITTKVYPQNPEWILYNMENTGLPNNVIYSVAIDSSDDVWIGTENGLVKFNGTNWTTYNTSNSALPLNIINSIAIDHKNNVWIGMYEGCIAKFDGTNWNIYNTSIPSTTNNSITAIVIDSNDDKWIGIWGSGIRKFDGTNWLETGWPGLLVSSMTSDEKNNIWVGTIGNLAKFDRTNWTIYQTSNSPLPYSYITSIAIDENSNAWIGSNGLIKFDGTNWTRYTTDNSDIPDNTIYSITFDQGGNKWIGTRYGGLAKFDGTNWTTYNKSNSGLPDNYIRSIVIDGNGNKWIGTNGGGLTVYKEGGVVSIPEETNNTTPKEFLLNQNYPNPFNPTTKIRYQIPKSGFVSLKVYDLLGREVSTLVNEEKSTGNHGVEFDGSDLTSGIYFYSIQVEGYTEFKKMILIK